jgi:hypothetical protein
VDPDPDPPQNVMDPQHCTKLPITCLLRTVFKKLIFLNVGGDAAKVILPATACAAGQQGGAGHLRARPHCRPLQVGSHPMLSLLVPLSGIQLRIYLLKLQFVKINPDATLLRS